MKTINLLIIATILFTINANSQITKGFWMVGGSGSFTSYKSTFDDNNIQVTQTGSGLLLKPNVGYFFIDKFAGGIVTSLSFSNPEGNNNNSIGYGLSPFIRYYFLNPEKTINIFSQVSYGISQSKSDSGVTNNSNGYTLEAGSAIFFNSSVALEFTIDYDSSSYNNNSKSNNFTIGIGFQIHLEKK